MHDLDSVLPSLNLLVLNAGILMIVQLSACKIDDVVSEHAGLQDFSVRPSPLGTAN